MLLLWIDEKIMSRPGTPIFFKYSADDLFFFAFNINMGLLPPFITLASNKALQIPLIMTATLIYARLLLRPKVLARFAKTLGDPNILLIFALIGLLIISALTVSYAEGDRLRILLKPGLVLLAMTTLRYAVSNRCEINQNLLGKFLVTGMIIGIMVIACLSYWNDADLVRYLDDRFGLVRVHKLNRALEIASVLVFLSGIAVVSRIKSVALTVFFVLSLFVLSLNVVGSAFWTGAWHPKVHVDSETVQFGLPLAFAVFIIAQRFPRFMTNAIFAGIGVILLTAPWMYQFIYKILDSVIDHSMPIGIRKILLRSEIWDIVATKSLESPIFGHGIDSARYLGNIVVESTYKPINVLLHPHNMILQIWLDLGFVGVAIVAGLLFIGWRYVSKLQPIIQPPILGGLTMLIVFSAVSHSLWQTWSVSLIAIFVTLAASLHSHSPKNLETS